MHLVAVQWFPMIATIVHRSCQLYLPSEKDDEGIETLINPKTWAFRSNYFFVPQSAALPQDVSAQSTALTQNKKSEQALA